MVLERSYTPPPAPEQMYLQMLDDLGMQYGVLVQISVYGTDNRYLLKVLRRNPNRLRGIAVVSPSITDSELEEMHAAGVRGLRINVLFGGGIGFKAMELLATRIAPLGWHMQFLMDVRTLPELMPRMIKLPVPGIIDHMGHAPVSMGLDAPGFVALRHLVSPSVRIVVASDSSVANCPTASFHDQNTAFTSFSRVQGAGTAQSQTSWHAFRYQRCQRAEHVRRHTQEVAAKRKQKNRHDNQSCARCCCTGGPCIGLDLCTAFDGAAAKLCTR